MPSTSTLLAWFLLVNLSVVTIWDIYVITFEVQMPTVSMCIYNLGRRNPLLFFWVGVAIGHIMMPLIIHNGNP